MNSILVYLHVLLLGNQVFSSDVCNPVGCFGQMSKIFEEEADKNLCMKLSEIENCIQNCNFKEYMTGTKILEGLQSMKDEICNSNQSNKVSNKCVDKHKYLLFYCIQESFNINAVDVKVDEKLLMCRKISEAQQCHLGTLVLCSLHASYIAEVLIRKLLMPLSSEFCTYTRNEVYDLNVTYPVLSNDYKNLAICFDQNSHLLDRCVSKKLAASDSVAVFSFKLCKDTEIFIDCLTDVVQERCHRSINIFKSISHFLYEYTLPKCFPFSDSNKYSKEMSQKSNNELISKYKSDISLAANGVSKPFNAISFRTPLTFFFLSAIFYISYTLN